MNKKVFIQGFLFTILIFFIYTFTFNYFFKNKKEDKIEIKEDSIDNNQNLIRNIKYNSKNKKGDTFSLVADYGEIDAKNSNQLFLTNVKGQINTIDGQQINIVSNFADFDNKSFETKFLENVTIISNDEKIYGDELYIVLDASEQELIKNPKKIQNKAILTGNIKILREDYKINSDVVEIDLITLDSKVYMLDNKKKVTIENY
ncbi:hypothetical protein [Candidatus Pelagibacter sp.]|uniref:hypothetical protein n=1 Tax=Candidatus Pelagibacter sp. TaxID=2024849 RepID=UPI003F850053